MLTSKDDGIIDKAATAVLLLVSYAGVLTAIGLFAAVGIVIGRELDLLGPLPSLLVKSVVLACVGLCYYGHIWCAEMAVRYRVRSKKGREMSKFSDVLFFVI